MNTNKEDEYDNFHQGSFYEKEIRGEMIHRKPKPKPNVVNKLKHIVTQLLELIKEIE